MAEPDPDDAILMAYVDGELSPDEAAGVRRMLEDNTRAAARVALFEKTRAALQASPGASAPPVGERLLANVRAAAKAREPVVRFSPRPSRRPGAWLPTAMAACLALAAGGVLGFGLAERGRPQPALADVVADARWRSALADLPSGESRDIGPDKVTAVASFRDGQGRLCREFGHRAAERNRLAVLCREGEGWHVVFQMAIAIETGQDYRSASSHEALDAYLAANKAGAPMSREEERAALRLSP
ncbi:hypothetical protein ASE63_08050 [Bosea sp. Root381]|uniref:anti-sigma factor family protein n=1 Tax=Bosea sp. Root381 TaxID=1736524 RepID=UPI0006F64BF5|nr:hypothetical protein [Bosea sp. Root381]KRE02301.1 hypothetical protein ASE63_08050 [Bosea sp. Root381]